MSPPSKPPIPISKKAKGAQRTRIEKHAEQDRIRKHVEASNQRHALIEAANAANVAEREAHEKRREVQKTASLRLGIAASDAVIGLKRALAAPPEADSEQSLRVAVSNVKDALLTATHAYRAATMDAETACSAATSAREAAEAELAALPSGRRDP